MYSKAPGVEAGGFVRTLLRFYGPMTHEPLFPEPLPLPANKD
ncbi:hypothetical protein [Rhodovarius sp.]